ncbi:cupin domain-containing protein [Glycocaulis sp.]|uniref:cupin domain-containing protein n=1 Tax=Glycocaulis sp. TaxID=1969725 RepID=UPI003D22DA29
MPAREDAHLFDYAAGTGPAAIRLLAECQAALNPQASAYVRAAETGFGGLLAGLHPASMPANALDAVLARAEEPAAGAPDDDQVLDPSTGLPRALSPYIERSASGGLNWSRRLGGVQEIVLDAVSDETAEASLVLLKPGGGIPPHDHGGEELTLVLTGAFHDGHALYRAGDLCSAAPGMRHRPAVQGNVACICLTVSMGEWKPVNPLYGWIDRLARPMRRLN